MQMVTGGNTGASGKTDLLSRTDDGAVADTESAKVHIYGFEAVLMINGHIVAGSTAVAGIGNACSCCIHRPSGSRIQVNTLMIGGCARGR